MAVSSIKGCWYKFSARIRDYIDVVDSYYRPNEDIIEDSARLESKSSHKRGSACNRSSMSQDKQDNHAPLRSHSHHNHHCHSNHNDSYCCDYHRQCKPQFQKLGGCERPNQLPPGFTKRKTSQGQVYFVDSNNQRYWYDPNVPQELLSASLNLDCLVGPLSSTWEVRQTPTGKTYFVNHTKKTTQFTDPRLVLYKDDLMRFIKHAQCVRPVASNNPNASTVLSRNSLGRQANTVNSTTPASTQLIHASNNSPQGPLISRNCNKCSHHHHHHHKNHRNSDTTHGNSQHANNPLTTSARHNNTLNRLQNCSSNHHPSQQQRQYRLVSGSYQNLSNSASSNRVRGADLSTTPGQRASNLLSSITNRTSDSPSINCSGSVSNIFSLSANSNMPSFESHNKPNQQHELDQNSRNNKELYDKISILRQELLKQQVISHPCKIEVHRKRIFEESFRIVSHMQPSDLKKRLIVKFRGEEGLDYGGVAREWFYLLSKEILNPNHGLFQYTSDDIYNLQINPDSGIVYREHLAYMNFCGRVIGMAVFHGHFIEGHFTLPFYKMLLKKPITLEDIKNVDPELHRSLCWILENDITNVIDTTFLVQHNAFGELQEHELKDNGRNIVVTEENKHEYVKLYVNYRCRRGIENQFEALKRGFYELISPSLVESFDEYELELLIGGLSKINIEDWRLHTKLKNCTVDSPLVRWFWEIVKSYGEDKRARLLQFVTGSPRVPIQGFKALQGVNSELRLFTIHLIKNACTDDLPKSHTCFNRIDLPPYESFEKLRDKLTQAIEETMGFAMQ